MEKFKLENAQVLVEFLSFGGILTKMINKKTGQNYVLAYEKDTDYLSNPYFFGATIGRNAGRTFPSFYRDYSGKKIMLDTNEGRVHLHGGKNGFHQVEWQVEISDQTSCKLSYFDSHSLYDPMNIELIYSLEKNRFSIKAKGTSLVPTVCNVTNHSYFNLNEQLTIKDHHLQMAAAEIQLIDEQFIPTTKYSAMHEPIYAPFGFEQEKPIGQALELQTELSKICADGIDLAYRFTENDTTKPRIVLTDPQEKNKLTVYSDQEACVVYTLNKISDKVKTDRGYQVEKFGGITFEMQRTPNYVQTEEDILATDYSAVTIYEIG
ncbi:aldose epimerase family protein [Enterococcus hulanensis]|uniref:aldose epimerase family protein n=1 Tax=Enterococcus hulanensis TaxID=2559929 RepID=UPI0014858A13|nr:hypothetical protein [Enterococcus hulanensis]